VSAGESVRWYAADWGRLPELEHAKAAVGTSTSSSSTNGSIISGDSWQAAAEEGGGSVVGSGQSGEHGGRRGRGEGSRAGGCKPWRRKEQQCQRGHGQGQGRRGERRVPLSPEQNPQSALAPAIEDGSAAGAWGARG